MSLTRAAAPGLDLGSAQHLVEVEILGLLTHETVVDDDGHLAGRARLDDVGGVEVVVAGEEQPDHVGAAGGESACVAARNIAQIPHRLEYPLAGLLAHCVGAAQHARHRGNRYLRSFGDVVHGGGFRHPFASSVAICCSQPNRGAVNGDPADVGELH
jgi:hypothetical protein